MKAAPFVRLSLIGLTALLALAPQASIFAGQPVDPSTLNPPPPSFETCRATGDSAICEGSRADRFAGPFPFGLTCGTAANPVELLIEQGTDSFRFTRYYNAADNLTRRFTREHFDATVVDPVTGLSALTTQIAEFIDSLAVPGDLATATFQQTGVVKFYMPGSGVLFIDVGRAVIAPDGSAVAESGKHPFDQYFSGDHSVLAPLCAALGTPGTP